jgi:hypothetical protein
MLPCRAQALDLAARHPDRPGEFAGLAFEPPPTPDHKHRDRYHHDQIDARRSADPRSPCWCMGVIACDPRLIGVVAAEVLVESSEEAIAVV